MAWTKERVSLLIDLWTSGKSASIVAKEIGNISRNAVIGKIHRLGISNRINTKKNGSVGRLKKHQTDKLKVKTHSKDKKNYKKDSHNHKLSADKQSTSKKNNSLRNHLDNSKQGSKRIIQAQNPENLLELKKISLLELRENTCRWPSGDPKTGDFSFCGCFSEQNSPYCDYHAKIAYTQTSKRDSKRESKQFIIVEQKSMRHNEEYHDNLHIDILAIKKNPDENINFL